MKALLIWTARFSEIPFSDILVKIYVALSNVVKLIPVFTVVYRLLG